MDILPDTPRTVAKLIIGIVLVPIVLLVPAIVVHLLYNGWIADAIGWPRLSYLTIWGILLIRHFGDVEVHLR